MTTARELVAGMTDAFNADKAAGINTTIQLDLTGDGGGRWDVTIANGTCQISQTPGGGADLTISMDATDFVAMQKGDLQPMAAFMQGKIKLQGDMSLAMKFQELFT
jgi:putative sterol carrier protein